MRFYLLTVLTLLICFQGFAQPDWNIFGGAQISSTHYTIEGVRQHSTAKGGIQAGFGCKIPFENQLSFAPSAFYSLKGYKVDYTGRAFPPDTDAVNNNTTIHTFEVAGLFQFDFNMKPSHAFLKVGPSLDFQLFGHEKFKTESGGTVSRSMKYGFGDYGRFSANLIAQFGFETENGLMVFVQYTRGFTSINNADYGPSIFHRAYGISIGKYLHRKGVK